MEHQPDNNYHVIVRVPTANGDHHQQVAHESNGNFNKIRACNASILSIAPHHMNERRNGGCGGGNSGNDDILSPAACATKSSSTSDGGGGGGGAGSSGGGDDGVREQKFNRICVFCGSKSGKRMVFSEAALQLGQELVDRKIELVYGGGGIGLMGLISKTVFEGGCRVIGVIPQALTSHQMADEAIGEMKVVADMHERKAEMSRLADAFIAMPGGYGTLEELLEIITWSQLGIHDKPVGLLNVDGYYDSLLNLFDKSVEEGFMKIGARQIVLSAPTPKELLTKMQEYIPIHDTVASRQSWEIEQLEFFST